MGDPDSFCRAIPSVERLIGDPGERTRPGRNSRAYVEQHAGRNVAMQVYQGLLAVWPGRTLDEMASGH